MKTLRKAYNYKSAAAECFPHKEISFVFGTKGASAGCWVMQKMPNWKCKWKKQVKCQMAHPLYCQLFAVFSEDSKSSIKIYKSNKLINCRHWMVNAGNDFPAVSF